MKYPKIEYKGLELYQVGCRKCQQGDYWKIYSDKLYFVAECKCGHRIEIPNNSIKHKPDIPQSIPLYKVI